MALKEVKNATPTMRLEGEKMGPVTTTTMTSRAVEALRRLQGYRFLILTTFCKDRRSGRYHGLVRGGHPQAGGANRGCNR